MGSFQPFSIDDGVLSEPRRPAVQVPEGDYLGVIRGIFVPDEDADAVNYYRFDVELVGGHAQGTGKRVPFRTTMQDAAPGKKSPQFGIGNLLASTDNQALIQQLFKAGQLAKELKRPMIDTYERFKTLGETIYGVTKDKQICVSVGDRSYNGTTYSEVKGVYPAADYKPATANRGGPVVGPSTSTAPSANEVGANAAQDNSFTAAVDNIFAQNQTV